MGGVFSEKKLLSDLRQNNPFSQTVIKSFKIASKGKFGVFRENNRPHTSHTSDIRANGITGVTGVALFLANDAG